MAFIDIKPLCFELLVSVGVVIEKISTVDRIVESLNKRILTDYEDYSRSSPDLESGFYL